MHQTKPQSVPFVSRLQAASGRLAQAIRSTVACGRRKPFFRVRYCASGMPGFGSALARVVGDQTLMLTTPNDMSPGARINVLRAIGRTRKRRVVRLIGRVVYVDPPGTNQNKRYLVRVAATHTRHPPQPALATS